MSGNNRTAKQPEYLHSEYDRLAMQSYLSGEDIVFSMFGLHEKQNNSIFNTNTIFTSHDNLDSMRNFPSASFSDTVYFDLDVANSQSNLCEYFPELCADLELRGGLRRYINPPHCPFYRIAGMWYCALDENVRQGRSFRECYEDWASDYFEPDYPPPE